MFRAREHIFWAGVHNVLVHPVMWLLRYPNWSCRVHDWTARRAWPKGHDFRVTSDRGE